MVRSLFANSSADLAKSYIPEGDYIMYKKLRNAAIVLALIVGTLSGCRTADAPLINNENPASVVSSFSSMRPNTSSSKPKSESSSASTVTPEFKERLDGYEEFFNEYIKFLNDYNKASDRTEMVSQLADYNTRREEVTAALNSIDESALSKPDATYYADVTYRISKKLDSIEKMYPSSSSSSSTKHIPKIPEFSFPKPHSASSVPEPHSASSAPEPYTPSSVPAPQTSSSAPAPNTSSSVPSNHSMESAPSSAAPESTVSSSEVPVQPSVTDPINVPEPDTSSLMSDYTRKWGYNQLNSAQQAAYARLYETVNNNQSGFDVTDLGLNTNDADIIYWAFDYDNAQFLTLGSGYNYKYRDDGTLVEIGIQYGRGAGEVPTDNFTSAAQSVISAAQQFGSDYDRLKYIHDWIVNNTTYTKNGPLSKSEADGPVVYGSALCEGYSKAFMYMAQAMGYECVCIAGTSGGGPHMWNMVKLDGSWYHVDATWDDPVSNSGPILRHKYFLVSDSTIRADHIIDNPFAVPSAPNDYQ